MTNAFLSTFDYKYLHKPDLKQRSSYWLVSFRPERSKKNMKSPSTILLLLVAVLLLTNGKMILWSISFSFFMISLVWTKSRWMILAGIEVNAQPTGKVCAITEVQPNCNDSSCVDLCVAKYGGPSGQDANGFCQPPSTCLCTHKC